MVEAAIFLSEQKSHWDLKIDGDNLPEKKSILPHQIETLEIEVCN